MITETINGILYTSVGKNEYFTIYTIDLLYFGIILVTSFIIASLLSRKIKKSLYGRMSVNEREKVSKIVYFVIVVLGFFVALPHLKGIINLSGLLIAGGFLSIIVGLAGQTVIANFFSGIILFFEQPIKIGDNVGVGDTFGTVEDVRILSTIIKTYDGVHTRIPNETLFTSNITNYVVNVGRRYEYLIRISYADDAKKAIKIIWNVIDDHPFALKSPSPSIFVNELGDNGVILSVRIWSPSSEWWNVRKELLWNIKVALEENGIQIPFPQRTLWFPEGTGSVEMQD